MVIDNDLNFFYKLFELLINSSVKSNKSPLDASLILEFYSKAKTAPQPQIAPDDFDICLEY